MGSAEPILLRTPPPLVQLIEQAPSSAVRRAMQARTKAYEEMRVEAPANASAAHQELRRRQELAIESRAVAILGGGPPPDEDEAIAAAEATARAAENRVEAAKRAAVLADEAVVEAIRTDLDDMLQALDRQRHAAADDADMALAHAADALRAAALARATSRFLLDVAASKPLTHGERYAMGATTLAGPTGHAVLISEALAALSQTARQGVPLDPDEEA